MGKTNSYSGLMLILLRLLIYYHYICYVSLVYCLFISFCNHFVIDGKYTSTELPIFMQQLISFFLCCSSLWFAWCEGIKRNFKDWHMICNSSTTGASGSISCLDPDFHHIIHDYGKFNIALYSFILFLMRNFLHGFNEYCKCYWNIIYHFRLTHNNNQAVAICTQQRTKTFIWARPIHILWLMLILLWLLIYYHYLSYVSLIYCLFISFCYHFVIDSTYTSTELLIIFIQQLILSFSLLLFPLVCTGQEMWYDYHQYCHSTLGPVISYGAWRHYFVYV